MKRIGFGLLVFIMLVGCRIHVGPSDEAIPLASVSDEVKSAALGSAEGIAKQFDQGRYNEVWNEVGDYFATVMQREDFIKLIRNMRGAVGPLRERTQIGIRFFKKIDGLPEGHYSAVFFKSRYAKMTVTEKFVLSEERGAWRLVGYFIERKIALVGGKDDEAATQSAK